MGLDITAYRALKPAADIEFDEYGDPKEYDRYFQARENTHFPGRAEGLTDRAWYEFADSDGFRAGSYSGYGEWRDNLAQLAGYPARADLRQPHSHSAAAWAAQSGPFWELINFADNEGVIGPVVAAKLAKDFAEFDDRAKSFDPGADGWFYERYALWRRAFEMAADGGAVDFH